MTWLGVDCGGLRVDTSQVHGYNDTMQLFSSMIVCSTGNVVVDRGKSQPSSAENTINRPLMGQSRASSAGYNDNTMVINRPANNPPPYIGDTNPEYNQGFDVSARQGRDELFNRAV